ncbi:putative RNA-binding protein with PIN domain/Skp family chaperone for outer membrane proteins [Kitasatospora herbaricolor]|uniref:NYN domain-containing protein n=1 Tax=Kitasatospora herbaricolor TaxID=68217 RepID=UPI001E4C4D18|nr:NYN domain-containing protein [Kitasatospora herbaricolor]MDQ0307870.1 putative RNA-binding protein with PIN domain/Skp family chaperone for outer membrane proteins [Kitasatospora herbaricolor]
MSTPQNRIGAEDVVDAAREPAGPQGQQPAVDARPPDAVEAVPAGAETTDGDSAPDAGAGRAEDGTPAGEGDADERTGEQLDRPLPEGVRRRVVGIAADALGGLPVAELPLSLRQYAKFTPARRAKYAATALAAALESEPAFRVRIADRLRLGQPDLVKALEAGTVPGAADPMDVATAAYLLRPHGWARLVEQAGELAERAGAEGAAAESARLAEKLQAELAELRAAARNDLERQRAESESVRKEAESLRKKVRSLESDTRRAQAETRKLAAELEALRAASTAERSAADGEARRLKHRISELETAVEHGRRSAREGRSVEDMRLRLLLDTVLQSAQGLQRELALPVARIHPADLVEAVEPASASPHDVARRALAEDDPALLDQLLAIPQVHLVVDGYNVTKTGYPSLPLEQQRIRLLGGLAMLAQRTQAEVTCVFDGQDLDVPVIMAPPRGVRVRFSRTGETADELIRRLVRAEPQGRPVVVVSTDKEVADGVRNAGARPVASVLLLNRLGRA